MNIIKVALLSSSLAFAPTAFAQEVEEPVETTEEETTEEEGAEEQPSDDEGAEPSN
ncbi:MAG: hypothetical protein U0975_14880 [Erythrobacter sp.]|nr:hypothetical protein [Erythrobacter sp.]